MRGAGVLTPVRGIHEIGPDMTPDPAGFDVAQLLYGLLLMDGRSVPQDQETGRRWIQAAAHGGLPEAQQALAL